MLRVFLLLQFRTESPRRMRCKKTIIIRFICRNVIRQSRTFRLFVIIRDAGLNIFQSIAFVAYSYTHRKLCTFKIVSLGRTHWNRFDRFTERKKKLITIIYYVLTARLNIHDTHVRRAYHGIMMTLKYLSNSIYVIL